MIWRHQFESSISSMVLPLFHGSTWSDPLCQGHCVYFATIVATIHYNQPFIDSRKMKGTVFIWGKQLLPCYFKGASLFHRTSCSNFCLQPPHSFMVNVLIDKIDFIDSNSQWFTVFALKMFIVYHRRITKVKGNIFSLMLR